MQNTYRKARLDHFNFLKHFYNQIEIETENVPQQNGMAHDREKEGRKSG